MKILLKNALIFSPGSTNHKKKKDILVENGKITKIETSLPEQGKVVVSKRLMVSTGFFDMQANFFDPGLEYKEDISTGCRAASAGGFTGVALLPNTRPSIQTKNDIGYILAKSKNCLTDVFPYGSVTIDNKGEEITEMLDQNEAGAIAFTDGDRPIWNADIMLKSLLYIEKFNGLIINKPEDYWLNRFGHMHEGKTSTILGTKGMLSIAEEIMIDRDLRILKYAGGKIHFSNISTAESVKMIRIAKRNGLDVTCDIAAHQIAFTDEDLLDFNTNLKVNPPFRTEKDIKALIKGLEDDTIDIIVSSHTPHDVECKKLEFDHADFGITGLQTVLPILISSLGEKEWTNFINKITVNPRKRLGLGLPKIEVGEHANLTAFDPTIKWEMNQETNESKSENSPYWNKELTGKVLATLNNGKSFFAN